MQKSTKSNPRSKDWGYALYTIPCLFIFPCFPHELLPAASSKLCPGL